MKERNMKTSHLALIGLGVLAIWLMKKPVSTGMTAQAGYSRRRDGLSDEAVQMPPYVKPYLDTFKIV
jgi:hypothetical protein